MPLKYPEMNLFFMDPVTFDSVTADTANIAQVAFRSSTNASLSSGVHATRQR